MDNAQREVSERFENHAGALETAATVCYEQCRSIRRLSERLREKIATEMFDSIMDFTSVCRAVSENVHKISTHRGEVFPENSREYLDQEIRREEFRGQIKRWKKAYQKMREFGNDISRVEFDRMGTAELAIYNQAITDLSKDLSDLEPNDECLRACLVFSEIQMERRRLLHSLFTSPVQIGKEIGSTVLISMASLGASWGLIAGASMTGASVANSGMKNWRRASLLSGPELDCKYVIAKNLVEGNGIHLQDCFMRADIRRSPEDITREVMQEDVYEETVMISPYG